jgi:cell division protein ZapE
MFRRLTSGQQADEAGVEVFSVAVRRLVRDTVWFDFAELCGGNHDQSAYLQIAHRYHTVFLSDVPRMTGENLSAARRFTWLIDVLYDNHVKLVASFAVPIENLYEAGCLNSESQRIVSRLSEMQGGRSPIVQKNAK